MKKILFLLSALMMLLGGTQKASAQQSLSEATDSIKAIYEDAKKGDAMAQNQVGYWYFIGRHVKQDYKEAVKWWVLSGKQGNPYALGNLAISYQAGFGVEPDSVRAVGLFDRALKEGNTTLFADLENLANNDDIFYASYVGSCYKRGLGTKKNPGKAAVYYEKAANLGSVPAMCELGILYRESKKPDKAYDWFEKAAKAGNLTGIYYCGDMLQKGEGVAQDKEKGFNMLLRAADEGFPAAQYAVGNSYYTGDGTVRNEVLGAQWMLKAANGGMTRAQYALGMAYATGNGVDINFETAAAWLAVATQKGFTRQMKAAFAEGGELAGSNFLIYMLALKSIDEKNFEQALKDVKVLSKAKAREAKTLEAMVLLNPEYKKANEKKAVKLLQDGVKAGDPVAQYMLAQRYESGKGVDKDMVQAVSLYEKSSAAGYYRATCELGDLYYEGRGVTQDYAKAVELYRSVEALLTSSAAKRLAACYESGRGGLKVDKKMAEKIEKIKPVEIAHLFQFLPAETPVVK